MRIGTAGNGRNRLGFGSKAELFLLFLLAIFSRFCDDLPVFGTFVLENFGNARQTVVGRLSVLVFIMHCLCHRT